MTMPREQLLALFEDLQWRGVKEQFTDLVARAIKSRWHPEQLFEQAAMIERRYRDRKSLERRLRSSEVNKGRKQLKMIADFDWNWPTKIDRHAIERALAGALVEKAENLVLLAAQGLGKTMIGRNLVYETVMRGQTALFVEAPQMLLDLTSKETSRALEHRLRHYARPSLLCIDEVGYLSTDARSADMLFEVVSRRYERAATVVTTNLAFADWPTVFPNASCIAALVDRLTHHADIVAIEGKSYRKHEAEQRQKRRKRESTAPKKTRRKTK
jgi:DNA replication protein DnaC